MGLRETINKNPTWAGLGAVLLVGVAVAWAVLSVGNDGGRVRTSKAFYGPEDGSSYFAEDIDKVYPFEHHGKLAYRVYVYQCGSAKPFIGYLARYTEGTRAKLLNLQGKTSPEELAELAALRGTGIEVKTPGGDKWVGMFTEEGQSVMAFPTCPDGSRAKGMLP